MSVPETDGVGLGEGDTPPPVTVASCSDVHGPFFHGTAATLRPGDEIVAGRRSHFRPDRPLRHVYFSSLVETAVWGAELAAALSSGGRGHVYVVEPRGPFEDDPNVTDKRLPGNPTRSFRSLDPLLVVAEVVDWEGHDAEALQRLLDGLAAMQAAGRGTILD